MFDPRLLTFQTYAPCIVSYCHRRSVYLSWYLSAGGICEKWL